MNFETLKAHRVQLLTLTIVYWLLTIPFLSHYPFNWDAAQFTLGVSHYDLNMHQPHPPGYPWYVWVGQLLATVVTPHTALLIITTVVGYIATIAVYGLLTAVSKRSVVSLMLTSVWILNPLFWLHREVALTYVVDAAASALVAWFAYNTFTTRQRWNVYAASVVLAIAGGFRPSLLMLLLPLHLFQLWFHKRNLKVIVVSGVILLLGTLAWLIPVLMITGGLNQYLSLSKNLYGTAAETSSIFAGANPSVIWQEVRLVFGTIGASLNMLGLGILLSALLGLVAWWQRGWRAVRFYWPMVLWVTCWILPALFVYCFVHFGQIGYALILMPAAYVALLPGVLWSLRVTHWLRWPLRWGMFGIVLIHAAVFVLLSPKYAHPNYIPSTRADVILQKLARQQTNAFKLNWAMIKESDQKISNLVTQLAQYPAEETLIVTGRNVLYPSPLNGLPIRNDEVFRELSAVLPEYRIVEIAPDRGYYLQSQNARMTTIGEKKIDVPNRIKYVVLVFDQLPSNLVPQPIITEDRGNYYLGIMDKAWQFAGFTVQRDIDEPYKRIIPSQLLQP